MGVTGGPEPTWRAKVKAKVVRVPPVSRLDDRIHNLVEERERLQRTVAELQQTVEDRQRQLAEFQEAAGCLEFVPGGHYYSAVPDIRQVGVRHVNLMRRSPEDVPGVDLRLDRQLRLLERLGEFASSVPFSSGPSGGLRYGFSNGAFEQGDGTMWHVMLRYLQPRQVIEVGSGHSSACLLDTAEHYLGNACAITFIEPYDDLLRSLLRDDDTDRVEILAEPVQDVPVERFAQLADRDVLFIDSTHVSKVGSDVNYLFFEVLPALQPGVVVHLHDVFPRFEYPWNWIEEGRAWQEDYLLRAFLQYNDEFEVLFWPSFLHEVAPEEVDRHYPIFRQDSSGSIYLRRRGGSDLGC